MRCNQRAEWSPHKRGERRQRNRFELPCEYLGLAIFLERGDEYFDTTVFLRDAYDADQDVWFRRAETKCEWRDGRLRKQGFEDELACLRIDCFGCPEPPRGGTRSRQTRTCAVCSRRPNR